MNTSEITLYENLAGKLGKKETGTLIGFIKSGRRNETEQHLSNLLVKQDKIDLIEKINAVETSFTEKLSKAQVGLISWMAAMWLSAVALIVGILKFF